MARFVMPKCVKCRRGTFQRCAYCDDIICNFHSRINESGKVECSYCTVKFYRIWLQEKDYEHTTELEYNEWLKEKAEKEMDIGKIGSSGKMEQ